MSSTSIPTIRYALRVRASPLRLQRRWARVQDVRFVATHRDQQQIQARYKDKLQQKARQEGHQSIDSLKEAYKEKITEFKRAANTLDQPSDQGQQSRQTTTTTSGLQQPPPPPPQPQIGQNTPASSSPSPPHHTTSSDKNNGGAPGIKSLSSYVDVDKISALPKKEIEYLWRLRFASDPKSLCAVIPIETYTRIYANARQHPQFILPLPRPAAEDGSDDVKQSSDGFAGDEARTAADIHFLQWSFHPPATSASTSASSPTSYEKPKTRNTHISTVLFTHLAAFKLHGSYAQPHTTVTHHLDLADSHGIVLLQGGVVEGKGVSPDEATWLLMCLQKFYDFESSSGPAHQQQQQQNSNEVNDPHTFRQQRRRSLLEKFSQGDTEGFKIEDLMDEAERVS